MVIFLAVTAALAATASASLYPGLSTSNHTCVLDKPFLSCSPQANPSIVDTCCVETYGGLVLQTQYWDTYTGYETQGQLLPPHTWTIRMSDCATTAKLNTANDSLICPQMVYGLITGMSLGH